MKRWLCALAALALMAVLPASADLFQEILGGKKKSESPAASGPARQFKFMVYLTTGDVLKGVEFKGGSSGKKGTFRFISNFESDIDVKTPYIKYIDMDMVGEQMLEDEYVNSKFDRVYPKNQDVLTGKVVGFTAKDVQVTTSYGDLKASVGQVRYIMFRNPSTTPEAMPSMLQQKSAPASAAPAASPSSAPSKSDEEK